MTDEVLSDKNNFVSVQILVSIEIYHFLKRDLKVEIKNTITVPLLNPFTHYPSSFSRTVVYVFS